MRFCSLKVQILVLKMDSVNRSTAVYSSAYSMFQKISSSPEADESVCWLIRLEECSLEPRDPLTVASFLEIVSSEEVEVFFDWSLLFNDWSSLENNPLSWSAAPSSGEIRWWDLLWLLCFGRPMTNCKETGEKYINSKSCPQQYQIIRLHQISN